MPLYNSVKFTDTLQLVALALLVNYILIVAIRTIYRYRMIDKYWYDYYDLKKMTRLAKTSINLQETIKKVNNLYIVGYLLVAEAILYYIIM